MTRRKVFALGGQALGGLAIAIPGLAVLGFSAAPIFETPEERWQSVGPLEDYGPDTYTQTVITEVDGIGEAGKQTVYVRQGNPEIFDGESADEYVAVSNRCAHLGCPVRFVKAAGNFICPCHGGVYDFEGKVVGGPPVRPLDRFQTRVNGDQLEVGPRFSVTSDLEPVRSRDPGEFTGGIWEYLYPPRPSTPPAP
ncbi:Rieske (2Fe-2S) protein [Thermoleophilia bacterium SCSIO 60948]|nr:Rieske (2Fe-2S) protein [Thermoleophilia bacterium SCSIO 60948]